MLSLRSMITVAVTAALSLGLAIGANPQARAKVGEAAAKARLAAEAAFSWAQSRVDALEVGAWGALGTQADASTGAEADSQLDGRIDSGGQARIGTGAEIGAGAQTEVESSLDLGGFFDWILEVGLGFGVRSGADAQAGAGS